MVVDEHLWGPPRPELLLGDQERALDAAGGDGRSPTSARPGSPVAEALPPVQLASVPLHRAWRPE